MKWERLLLIVALGALFGALFAVWWVNGRRVPTLRVSHTLGRGSQVGLEWIEIK